MFQEQISQNQVLVNSLPKSGTHLLAKAVEFLGYQEYLTSTDYVEDMPKFLGSYQIQKVLTNQGISKAKTVRETQLNLGVVFATYVEKSLVKHWLQCLKKGQYLTGHIPYSEKFGDVLSECNYYHLCIIRDPRAVTISRMKFILNSDSAKDILPDGIPLKADLELMSIQERINFLLHGGYGKKTGLKVNSFADIYRSVLAWKQDPRCLLVRFEDLIGEEGGGSKAKQEEVLRNIANHLNISGNEKIALKTNSVYNTNTRTFRVGSIHSWKSSLESEYLTQLMEYCEPLCQEAGYLV